MRSVFPTPPGEQLSVKQKIHVARFNPQPLLGSFTMGLAVVLVACVWTIPSRASVFGTDTFSTVILGVLLVSAYILTHHFPIQVREDMPVCVGSVPALSDSCSAAGSACCNWRINRQGHWRTDCTKESRGILLRRGLASWPLGNSGHSGRDRCASTEPNSR